MISKITIAIMVIFLLVLYKYRYTHLPIKRISNGSNIIDVFKRTSTKYSNHPALKIKRQNKWQHITYSNYYEHCKDFANTLHIINIQGPVCIIGCNAPGWFYAHLGSMMANVIPIGIYPSTKPIVCKGIINNCNPELLVVENMVQLNKFAKSILSKNNKIKAVVSYSNVINKKMKKLLKIPIYTWSEFIDIGTSTQSTKNNIIVSKIATIIYTSGSTSNIPKGVMITHDNIISMATAMIDRLNCPQLNIEYTKERFVSYLPLNHIAAQMLDIYIPIYIASTVWIADKGALKKSTLRYTLQEAHPTIFASVPRVWEKIMEKVEIQKGKTSKILNFFVDNISNLINIKHHIITKELGLNKCKYFITMGAPISQSVVNYYNSLGINLYNIYGMSETTGPISISTICHNRYGSVGKPIDNIKIKIDKKGEILVHGPTVFSSYYRNPEETSNVFDSDGWFHTGDTGYVDKDGYLFIDGRIKDIIITSGGENVAPIPIEDSIRNNIPLIDQIIVVGDNKKYLTALITLKIKPTPSGESTVLFTKDAKDILKSIGSKSDNIIDAVDDLVIKKYIDKRIKKINTVAPSNVHTIKKWIIIPEVFTIKGGEYTPTMKLRRKYIYTKHKKYIDMLYQ